MGKAAIVNPYLDTMGGGERYTLGVAEALAKNGYLADIQWKNGDIKKKFEQRFGIKLNPDISFKEDVKRGDGYDVCFWVSDGSVPTLRARKNILHFQVPFTNVDGHTLLNRMKFFRINKIVCNSQFTKKFIDDEYGVKSIVVYPPVDASRIKPKRKEKTILYVGRFSSLVQSKNQDVLIREFRKLYSEKNPDWQLVLAGGIEIGAGDYINRLEKLSKDLPVKIIKSPSFKELLDLYAKAKFFWSASGYGVNQIKNPQKVEHFGITTVEAMAAGCIPIVFGGGGQGEIIKDGENGFLWEKPGKLISATQNLINNPGLARVISQKAMEDAGSYSYERFEKEILSIV